jgi:hypothetical protein
MLQPPPEPAPETAASADPQVPGNGSDLPPPPATAPPQLPAQQKEGDGLALTDTSGATHGATSASANAGTTLDKPKQPPKKTLSAGANSSPPTAATAMAMGGPIKPGVTINTSSPVLRAPAPALIVTSPKGTVIPTDTGLLTGLISPPTHFTLRPNTAPGPGGARGSLVGAGGGGDHRLFAWKALEKLAQNCLRTNEPQLGCWQCTVVITALPRWHRTMPLLRTN